MPWHRRAHFIFLPVCILLTCPVWASEGGATQPCEDQGLFGCANGRCLEEEHVNNSVNDCGDNSDEVWEPCRTPLFTCTMGQGHCTMMTFVLDGRQDCMDASDEAKIIGTNCTMIQDCCFCSDYVPDSDCVDGACRCRSGFYKNTLGTTCTRRVVNDECLVDADCSDAFNYSGCVDGQCACDMGFYPSDNLTTCVARVVGDECVTDGECDSVIPHSFCTRGRCVCASGHYKNADRSACVRRRVGENCTVASDCTDVIPHSACVKTTCACLGDTIPSPDRHTCRLPVLGDPCETPEVCKYIRPISFCRSGSCDCQYGFHTPRDPYYCVIRKLGDACSRDMDCYTAVHNSRCSLQACDCNPGYRRHPNRTFCAWAKDPENIAAVTLSVFVICLLCLVLIATIPMLVYFFVMEPRKNLPKILRPTF